MKRDERIEAILSEIEGDSLVDIGCDHGKVLVSALREGRVKRALGVDISAPSLEKARALATEFGVRADFTVADGKTVLLKEFDVAVIAGMGGNEMIEILKSNVQFPKTLILVPHQDAFLLRSYLNEIRLFARKDYVVKASGRFYDIIVAGGSAPYTEKELYFGKNLPYSGCYKERLLRRLSVIDTVVQKNQRVSLQLTKEREVLTECLN